MREENKEKGKAKPKPCCRKTQNKTKLDYVQLCSSQVDKGKSDNLSENLLVENFLGENFFE